MPKIERLEDLRCWQEARDLTSGVYDLAESTGLGNDYRLRNQLTGAAVSTMSNIAEGFARYNKRDFMRFLDYAQSSAAELKSLLYVVHDQGYGDAEQVQTLQQKSESCQKMSLNLLRHVRSTLQNSSDDAHEPEVTYTGNGSSNSCWTVPPQFIATDSK